MARILHRTTRYKREKCFSVFKYDRIEEFTPVRYWLGRSEFSVNLETSMDTQDSLLQKFTTTTWRVGRVHATTYICVHDDAHQRLEFPIQVRILAMFSLHSYNLPAGVHAHCSSEKEEVGSVCRNLGSYKALALVPLNTEAVSNPCSP